jgi:hypothetical protein
MPRSIKITIIICAPFVLLVLLAPLLLGIRHGASWIPETPPVEAQRVFHPSGFSIIPPPGWVAKIVADSIIIGPGSKKVRHPPGFGVARLDHAPEISEFHKTMFQDLEAYEMTRPASGGRILTVPPLGGKPEFLPVFVLACLLERREIC